MKAFLSKVDGGVMVQARLEGDGIIGDVTRVVAPGEDFFDLSYDELAAMGDGEHEFKPTPAGIRHSGRHRR